MRVKVIYDDKFISVDGKGMFFAENWPFDETDIHAIQWYDDHGELEYKSREPNKELKSMKDILKYVKFYQEEYDKWLEKQRLLEEQERQRVVTWEDAMKELELQIDTMQKNHSEMIDKMKEEHDMHIERVHDQIQQDHMSLFYATNQLESNIIQQNNNDIFESQDMTIFDTNIDPSLFDDTVDPSELIDESEEDIEEVQDDNTKVLEDFSNFDLSLLEDEFNLDLLFTEEEGPVVNEIEELIKEEENKS